MTETTARRDQLRTDLVAELGTESVISDPEVRASYETDWTGRYSGTADCVVLPTDTASVKRVVELCAYHGTPVVCQGGNTGLVGGGVPRGGEVVLSLRRLDALGGINQAARQITVGAGVTLEALQRHLSGSGLSFAVDHGARSAATVGGMIATNAGGVHALRYGSMRSQVVGLEAILADGTVVRRMAGLLKDNAGYDLPSLFVGSEGTLCVVTQARLRLIARMPESATALFAVSSTEAAVTLLSVLLQTAPSLEAAELFYQEGMALVCEYRGLEAPFSKPYPAYVLVECAAAYDPTDELASAADVAGVRDVAVAVDAARRRALWSYREHHTEAINAAGIPHKLDVAVPVEVLADFETRCRKRIGELAPQATPVLFGHLGDGNIHVNIVGADPQDERLDAGVLELVADCGGTVSAEHGIGVAKRRWLSLTRSVAEIEAMLRIKESLDPQGLLNPGVLF